MSSAPVRMAMATASGMEWLTPMNSSPKSPSSVLWPACTSLRSAFFMPNSWSLLRKSPHVVLMSVGEDDAPDLVRVIPEIGEVRQYEVYSRHLLVRKCHPGVHQEDAAPPSHSAHVLADLAQASQGHDLQGVVA